MPRARSAFLFHATVSLFALAGPAWAETVNCTDVTTLAAAPPYVITAQGVYCLKSDINYSGVSGTVIDVQSGNVVLDLNSHKLGGPGDSATTASGILVNNRNNVIVRNGLVRGFYVGVNYIGGSSNNGNVVEDVMAVANTLRGIVIGPGTNNTIRNCIVATTGGSTFAPATTMGIYNYGPAAFVTNCTVYNTFASAGGTDRIGIYVSDGRAVGNQVIGDGGPGTNVCLAMASGIYKDNIVSRCAASYSGGTPVGSTNHP